MLYFYDKESLAPRPTPRVEDHTLSTVRVCLFSIPQLPSISGDRLLYPQPEDAPCRDDSYPQTSMWNSCIFLRFRVLIPLYIYNFSIKWPRSLTVYNGKSHRNHGEETSKPNHTHVLVHKRLTIHLEAKDPSTVVCIVRTGTSFLINGQPSIFIRWVNPPWRTLKSKRSKHAKRLSSNQDNWRHYISSLNTTVLYLRPQKQCTVLMRTVATPDNKKESSRILIIKMSWLDITTVISLRKSSFLLNTLAGALDCS